MGDNGWLRRIARPLSAAALAAITVASSLFADGATHTPRAYAASIVVNSLADTTASDGQCTLREAMTNANDNAATHPDCTSGSGADTITFSVSGTMVLGWTPPPGGVDAYLLQVINLDGSVIPPVLLPPGADSTMHPVVAAGTCFQLIAFKAGGFGITDVLCGIPGYSTLSAGAARRATADSHD